MLFDHTANVVKQRNHCNFTQDQSKNTVQRYYHIYLTVSEYFKSTLLFSRVLARFNLLLASRDSQGEKLCFKSAHRLHQKTSLCLTMGNEECFTTSYCFYI